jgi:hypothetical protein
MAAADQAEMTSGGVTTAPMQRLSDFLKHLDLA